MPSSLRPILGVGSKLGCKGMTTVASSGTWLAKPGSNPVGLRQISLGKALQLFLQLIEQSCPRSLHILWSNFFRRTTVIPKKGHSLGMGWLPSGLLYSEYTLNFCYVRLYTFSSTAGILLISALPWNNLFRRYSSLWVIKEYCALVTSQLRYYASLSVTFYFVLASTIFATGKECCMCKSRISFFRINQEANLWRIRRVPGYTKRPFCLYAVIMSPTPRTELLSE